MDPKSAARARVGRVLKGKWRLEQLIGVGGTAAVYLAVHRNGNRVAVKMLHPELSLNQELHARFVKEGYVANAVDHPSVVRVLDDDVAEDGGVFLVMELLEGEPLDTVWRRKGRRLPPVEVATIGDAVLDVLAVAHERGIVHRDIKPQNLFLTRAGVIKVLDFGIARLLDAPTTGPMITVTGALLGTPGFMSPEQARGRSTLVDSQSDLWSVGATLFALVTGRLVHEAETPNERLLAAMTAPAPPVHLLVPDVPPGLARAIDRALAFEKSGRWPDARSMQAALRASLAGELGVAPTAAGLPTLLPTITEVDPPTREIGKPTLLGPGPEPGGATTALAAAAATRTRASVAPLAPPATPPITPVPTPAPATPSGPPPSVARARAAPAEPFATPVGALVTPPALSTPAGGLFTPAGDQRMTTGVALASEPQAAPRGPRPAAIVALAAAAAVVGIGLGVAAFLRTSDRAPAPAADAPAAAAATSTPAAEAALTPPIAIDPPTEPSGAAPAPPASASPAASASAAATPSASAAAAQASAAPAPAPAPAPPKPGAGRAPKRDPFDRRD